MIALIEFQKLLSLVGHNFMPPSNKLFTFSKKEKNFRSNIWPKSWKPTETGWVRVSAYYTFVKDWVRVGIRLEG